MLVNSKTMNREIKSYKEMNALPRSVHYEYAMEWQRFVEDNPDVEIEWLNVTSNEWCAKLPGNICVGNIYRLNPQPTYAERQAKWREDNGIKIGSKVKVLRRADNYQDGWENDWEKQMDDCIGKTHRIEKFKYESGINFGGWDFPYFVLEPVIEEMVDLDFSDYLIGTELLRIHEPIAKVMIVGQNEKGIFTIFGFQTYSDLKKTYTYADGRRLEKEK